MPCNTSSIKDHASITRILKDRHHSTGAAQHGSINVTRHLLNRGARTTNRSWNGQTPLHIATQFGHHTVANALLNRGSAVNAMDRRESTPLHYAVKYHRVQIARSLLDRGANPNAKDLVDDETPLHIASKNGDVEIARLLIAKGANVKATSGPNRYMPLRYAVMCRHVPMIRLLVESGALQVNVSRRSTYLEGLKAAIQWGSDTSNSYAHVRFLRDVLDSIPQRFYATATPAATTTTTRTAIASTSRSNRWKNRKLRLHPHANGIDIATLNKVPLRNARIIYKENGDSTIRHVFHHNTISGLLRYGHKRHPVTRQQFSRDDVYKLEDVLHKNDHNKYARL